MTCNVMSCNVMTTWFRVFVSTLGRDERVCVETIFDRVVFCSRYRVGFQTFGVKGG